MVTKNVHVLLWINFSTMCLLAMLFHSFICTLWSTTLQVAWFLKFSNTPHFLQSWSSWLISTLMCTNCTLWCSVWKATANESHFLIYNVATSFNFPLCYAINPKIKCFLSWLHTWMIAFVSDCDTMQCAYLNIHYLNGC